MTVGVDQKTGGVKVFGAETGQIPQGAFVSLGHREPFVPQLWVFGKPGRDTGETDRQTE